MRNKKEFKKRFLLFIEDCSVKLVNPYHSINFYNKDGDFLMEFNLKNRWFFISDSLMWSNLEFKFSYNYPQIRGLIKAILEEHYKLEGIKITID